MEKVETPVKKPRTTPSKKTAVSPSKQIKIPSFSLSPIADNSPIITSTSSSSDRNISSNNKKVESIDENHTDSSLQTNSQSTVDPMLIAGPSKQEEIKCDTPSVTTLAYKLLSNSIDGLSRLKIPMK